MFKTQACKTDRTLAIAISILLCFPKLCLGAELPEFQEKHYIQIVDAKRNIFAGKINKAEEDLTILAKSEDRYLAIESLILLATLCRYQKRHSEAYVFAQDAAVEADKFNNQLLINQAYRELGAACRDVGNIDMAGPFLITAKEVIDKIGDEKPELSMATISAIATLLSAKKLNTEENQALNAAKEYGEQVCKKNPEMLAEFYLVAADCKLSGNDPIAAAALLQQCTALCKQVGGLNLFVPIAMQKLAEIKYEEKNFVEAENLFREATASDITSKSAFSSNAFNWNMSQASKLRQEVSAIRMEEWYERILLSIAQKKNSGVLKPDEAAVSAALDLSQKKQFDLAAKGLEQALHDGKFSENSKKELSAELLLAEVICELRNFDRACPHFDRAIKLAESSRDLVTVSDLLERKAVQSQRCGSQKPVIADLLKCWEIRKTIYGDLDPATAQAELMLGIAFASIGTKGEDWAKSALEKLEQVLISTEGRGQAAFQAYERREPRGEIRSKKIGTLTLALAYLLSGLNNHRDAGRAAGFSSSCLNVAGPADPRNTLLLHDALGQFLKFEGDYSEALLEFQRGYALASKQKFASWQQRFLLDFASVSYAQNDFLMAQKYLIDARALVPNQGTVKTDVSQAISDLDKIRDLQTFLAASKTDSDLFALAKAKDSIKNNRKEIGAKLLDHLIQKLNNDEPEKGLTLAEAYLLRSQLLSPMNEGLKRKVYLSRALELAKLQKTPTSNRLISQILTDLADQADTDGCKDIAANYARECIGLAYSHITTEAPSLSFAEQMSLVDSAEFAKNNYFKHCVSKRDLLLEYGHMLPLKGLLGESLRRQSLISKNWREKWRPDVPAKLQIAKQQITQAYYALHNSEEQPPSNLSAILSAFEKEEQEARSLLSGLTANGFRDPAIGMSVNNLLQEKEVFVDIYKYKKDDGSLAYSAIVNHGTSASNIRKINLGAAKEIDENLATWMSGIGAAKNQAYREVGSKNNGAAEPYIRLRDARNSLSNQPVASEQATIAAWNLLIEKLVNPLKNVIPAGTQTILLAPDSETSRFPWQAAFIDESELVIILDNPRHLKILRDPNIKVMPSMLGPFKKTSLTQAQAEIKNEKIFLVGDVQFNNKQLIELPDTKKEVEAISKYFQPDKVTILGAGLATKHTVAKHCSGNGIVHIATHGYFNPQTWSVAGSTDSAKGDVRLKVVKQLIGRRSPLLESGLFFAEDAVDTLSKQEGVSRLSAQEMTDLDLQKCKLLVLSACQTALGRLPTGQGVLGLHSAATAAGARCMLMSLWKVDDTATRVLMNEFYLRLAEGKDAALALKEAQKVVRGNKKMGWDDPLFWAAWQLSGEMQ